MRRLLFSIMILVLTGGPGLQRGIAQDARRLNLNDAIHIALDNNYSLKQARNNQRAADMQVKSAKADFLPSLNSSFRGSKRIGRQFNELTGEVGNFTSNGISGNLNANLDVFSGFQKLNSLQSSRYSAQAEQKNVQRIRQQVIFETASAYLQLLLDRELLRIDQKNLEISKERLEKIREQVKLGSLPKADLYNQQSAVASNKLAVTNSKNAVKMSRLQLIRQLQLNPRTSYSFVSPDLAVDSIRITPKTYDLDHLIEVSLNNRNDLDEQRLRVESSEEQLQVAQGRQYPSLSLSSSFGSSYNDRQRQPVIDPQTNQITGTKPVPFSDQIFDRNISRSFGLHLSFPIFSNLNRDNQIVQQRIAHKNAELQLENLRLQVIQEVTKAYNDYESIIQRLRSTREALKAARLAYRIQQERYRVGSASFIELNQANTDFIQARSNRMQAIYNYLFQKELLDYYIGKLDDDLTLSSLQKTISTGK